MAYYARIATLSVATLAITILLLVVGPRAVPLALVAQTPAGEEVPVGAPIRVTFSRPVDRQSAEMSFRLEPPAPGSFFWEDRILTFTPDRPLSPETPYRVSFGAGLRDAEGRASPRDLGWSFRTRGTRLLVARTTESGGSELWLVAPDGGGARQLLNAPEGFSDLALSVDGTSAVYVELRGRERSALMLLDMERGTTRPLVDDPEASTAAPAWSPEGNYVIFERRALVNGQLGAPRLWLAQPDGTLLGMLVEGDGSTIAYAAAWAPDGNRVAFLDGVSQAIMVYSFFTGAVTELPASSSERPAWLPDSTALVYSNAELGAAGPQLRLRLVTLGEAPAARDLTDGVGAELTPVVAPGGEAVAFTRRGDESPESRIWLVATAGGPPRPLTAAGPHQDIQPVWSPDGQQLAFIRSGGAGPRSSTAMVIDLASGQESIVFEDAVQVMWAP